MRKTVLVVIALALAALATTPTGGTTGTPAGGSTSPTFSATIGGVAVNVTLPSTNWSKGAVSPSQFTINGPNNVVITVTPLAAAKGLGKTDMDKLCQDKLAEKAKAVTTGSKIEVAKNSSGVTYALRMFESGGNVHFVGLCGSGAGGVMFYAKVPVAQKNAVKNALKNILTELALSG
ncbi:MAG TPA: hypothetical protein ENN88_02545 [Candidatus Coatesbacteria bacterium]|nr:hypothetical protein [Candidatus Coatesbacteria bacterium]